MVVTAGAVDEAAVAAVDVAVVADGAEDSRCDGGWVRPWRKPATRNQADGDFDEAEVARCDRIWQRAADLHIACDAHKGSARESHEHLLRANICGKHGVRQFWAYV